jgi:hypothetical protein
LKPTLAEFKENNLVIDIRHCPMEIAREMDEIFTANDFRDWRGIINPTYVQETVAQKWEVLTYERFSCFNAYKGRLAKDEEEKHYVITAKEFVRYVSTPEISIEENEVLGIFT